MLANIMVTVFSRSGVEDRKLEAKAKETKKIRGQGQPLRGQTIWRPRTEMLEAKAKNQGYRRKCFSNKRSSKFFFRQSQKRKQKMSLQIFCEVLCVFLCNFKNKQFLTIVVTDANAHHTT